MEQNEGKTMEDMLFELEEYAECAGFADYRERVLRKMTDAQIVELYQETFNWNEAKVLEEWQMDSMTCIER